MMDEKDSFTKTPTQETLEGKIIVHEDSIDKEFEQSFTIEVNDDFRTKISLPIKRTVRLLKR